MNNTPDYNNNLAFAPGDWSDSRVTNTTDRTESTIKLIEKIEELEKEKEELLNLWIKAHNIVIKLMSVLHEDKAKDLEKLIIKEE